MSIKINESKSYTYSKYVHKKNNINIMIEFPIKIKNIY